MLRLYNTLSRKKEELKPINKEWVGLYTCGPTVYNFAHIGNLRTYIFEDILQRALEYNRYHVWRVMNVTDVGHLTGDSDMGEDKIDKEARAEKKSVEEIAQFYRKAFFEDLRRLNVKKPNVIAPATKFINDQVALIGTLFQRGFAYNTPAAIYFDVSKDKTYGKLSGQSLAEKIAGARDEVVIDGEKRNAADFALWFKLVGKFKNHVLHWPSPWGEGFPGWHVECSAISRHFLGQPFDIHTGGVDHIGTHHTNEIAQSEAAYGKPLAHIWMHGEFLIINEARMGKSEGNFLTLSGLKKEGYPPLAFRYFVLGAHYRTKLNFTRESLGAAKQGLENLYGRCLEIRDEAEKGDTGTMDAAAALPWKEKFDEAIDDDLNTPKALSVVFEMLKEKGLGAKTKLALLSAFDRVLGLNITETIGQIPSIPGEVNEKFRKYKECRARKQFTQSDHLRKEIEALGYSVRDAEEGSYIVNKFFFK